MAGINKLSSTWKINGVPIYTPGKDTQIDKESLASSDSGRTEAGFMQIDWLRTEITKVYFTYETMTTDELSYMLSLVQGKEFTLTYYDPIDKAVRTIECYTSTSSMKLYNAVLYNGMWHSVTFNAIEK